MDRDDDEQKNLTERTVFFLSVPSDDSVSVDMRSLGLRPIFRRLNSSSSNWRSIATQITNARSSGHAIGVILLLNVDALESALLPSYAPAFEELAKAISGVATMAFIYSSTLEALMDESPKVDAHELPYLSHIKVEGMPIEAIGFEAGPYTVDRVSEELKLRNDLKHALFQHHSSSASLSGPALASSGIVDFIESVLSLRNVLVREVINALASSDFVIIPYSTRHERILKTKEFLESLATGQIMRLYVPHNRYQGRQLASFLSLLERFLRQVRGREFVTRIMSTLHGTIYTFHDLRNSESGDEIVLTDSLELFQTLMTFFDDSPKQASAMLEAIGIPREKASVLLAEYNRDYKRIIIDVKHEYERKRMELFHRLENDAINLSTLHSEHPIGANLGGSGLDVTSSPNPAILDVIMPTAAVSWNPEMSGDITYSVLDIELMSLFESNQIGLNPFQLRSSLEILKDTSASWEMRVNAKQEIAAFIFRIMPRVGTSAATQYREYVENLIINAT